MKQRIISAIVAIAIAIPFIYYGNTLYALGIGIIATLGFIEMIDLKKSHGQIPFIPTVIALLNTLLIVYGNIFGIIRIDKLLFILLSLLLPVVFYKDNHYTTKDAIYLIGTVLFLGIAFNSFIIVRNKGLGYFIYLVSIPIITDTFAYFLGMKFGKHKMCPKISPKKSWEGGIAGLVFGSVIPSIIYKLCIGTINYKIIIITIILSTIGQLGDLVFSKIKRENDIKDFSNLMPGHGGALDRLDSSIFIFMSYIFLLQILF